jgi:hypothetical protein
MPLLSQPAGQLQSDVTRQILVKAPGSQEEFPAYRQVATIGGEVRPAWRLCSQARRVLPQLLGSEAGERVCVLGNLPIDTPGNDAARRLPVRSDMRRQ